MSHQPSKRQLKLLAEQAKIDLDKLTFWQRTKLRLKESWTVRWGALKVVAGSLLLVIHEMSDWLAPIINNSEVKSAFAAMNFPAWAGLALAIIGVITLGCRLRPDTVDPIT